MLQFIATLLQVPKDNVLTECRNCTLTPRIMPEVFIFPIREIDHAIPCLESWHNGCFCELFQFSYLVQIKCINLPKKKETQNQKNLIRGIFLYLRLLKRNPNFRCRRDIVTHTCSWSLDFLRLARAPVVFFVVGAWVSFSPRCCRLAFLPSRPTSSRPHL